MGNNVYLEKSVDMLMMWFAEHGFPVGEFVRRSFGRVIMKDELEYFKEFRLLEPMRVTLVLAGLAQDGSRFLIRNEFHRQDGRLAARVNSLGGWLDLAARKLIAPPADLLTIYQGSPRSADFQVLPSSLK